MCVFYCLVGCSDRRFFSREEIVRIEIYDNKKDRNFVGKIEGEDLKEILFQMENAIPLNSKFYPNFVLKCIRNDSSNFNIYINNKYLSFEGQKYKTYSNIETLIVGNLIN